jgi:4-hydroxy-3-polyprenylbenzoate decarboxylase
MSYGSIREFLDFLKKDNELILLDQEVSTNLEITEIHQRLIKQNGPALLFNNVVTPSGKSNHRVLINLFGTKSRIAKALCTDVEGLKEIGKTLAFLRQPEPPASVREAIGMMPLLKKVLSMKPKMVKNAPCQEVVLQGNEINLNDLPIQYCWPGEPAPLITWPLVVTKGDNGIYNLGIYRMQVIGKNKALMRWLKHRGGAEHHRQCHASNQKAMPAAVVIGADPATTLSAVTPVPENLSEYNFAGFLRGKKIELVKCKTIPLEVPAQAEIVLEGYISFVDYRDEGPYGDHTGYYNDIEKFPVFEISAITMRKDAIYHTTYTGRPPDEPSVLGEALNEIFVPIIQQQFPEIIDFYLPPEGCSYRIAVVSIKKTYPGQAKRIMMGIWSYLKQFMYTKYIYVVDEDINCRDWKDIMWAVSTRMDPAKDITLIENTPIDYLDFASPYSGMGSKIGFDATNKVYPETTRNWGKKIVMDKNIIELVDKKWADIVS